MIKVAFGLKEIMDADKYAAQMKARRKGAVTQINNSEDRDKIAYLGELAFEIYLQHIGKKYHKHKDDTGKYGDRYDFSVGSKWFDVKSSVKYADKLSLMQHQKEKAEKNNVILVSVHVQLDLEQAIINGYCLPSELQEDGKYWSLDKFKMHTFKQNNVTIDLTQING